MAMKQGFTKTSKHVANAVPQSWLGKCEFGGIDPLSSIPCECKARTKVVVHMGYPGLPYGI